MVDIYDIKNVLFLFPRLSPDTWYVIILCIGIYCIHIFFLVLAERYRKLKQSLPAPEDSTHTFLRQLADIDVRDDDFFAKINLLLRLYLEKTNRVRNAIKKTSHEISETIEMKQLHTLLQHCTEWEYAATKTTITERQSLKELTESVIRKMDAE